MSKVNIDFPNPKHSKAYILTEDGWLPAPSPPPKTKQTQNTPEVKNMKKNWQHFFS